MSARGDFFEMLGVQRRFDLDVDELEKNYRERSKEAHPDRHVNAAASARVAAMQESMDLNRAVKTLAKPVPRAEYLLSLMGVTIGEHERLDPDTTMAILEAREELSNALAEGDQDKLEELEEAMLDRRGEGVRRIAELFAALGDDPSPAELEGIKRELVLMRYVDRYLEQFDGIDDDSGGKAA